MRPLWSFTAGLVLAAVTGCAPTAHSDGGGGTPLVDAVRAQAWALQDRQVTAEEYRIAMGRFAACVRDAGYPVAEPVLSPVDGLTLLIDITPSGPPVVYNGAVDNCNLSHISQIEPAYVEAQPHVMAEPLRVQVVKCLQERGISTTGDERNVAQLADSARQDAPVIDCVTDAARQVFPELPDTTTIRR